MGKVCVSYRLMPVYACPEVAKSLAPELKKRIQGKSCFNFRTPDDDRFAQLSELTKFSRQAYRKNKWL